MADAVEPVVAKDVTTPTFEERKWAEEKTLREEEIKLKREELAAKRSEQKWARLLNPLAGAIIGALLAGGATVMVARQNGTDQRTIESTKEGHENELEKVKAERARIVAVIQGFHPDEVAENIRLLLDANLITDPETRKGIDAYLKSRNGGQGAGKNVPTASSTPTPAEPITDIFETDWLGGGHNQNEACAQGIGVLQPKYSGKTLRVLTSGEQSRKDLLGHVTYKYFCKYEIR